VVAQQPGDGGRLVVVGLFERGAPVRAAHAQIGAAGDEELDGALVGVGGGVQRRAAVVFDRPGF
jgi:hypothetical protein